MVSYFRMLFGGYCPKCRTTKIFKNNPSYNSKKNTEMHEYCPSCNQKSELEVGFYYGTGYVSYAITVALSFVTFISYWLLIELPFHSTFSLIAWIIANFVLLFLLQPLLVRISRTLWLSWFV